MARNSGPVVLATNFELIKVLQGSQMRFGTEDGGHVTIRLHDAPPAALPGPPAGGPLVLTTAAEMIRILKGTPGRLAVQGGGHVTVRMYTARELIDAQAAADRALAASTGTPMVGPMTLAQAENLCRRLPADA